MYTYNFLRGALAFEEEIRPNADDKVFRSKPRTPTLCGKTYRTYGPNN